MLRRKNLFKSKKLFKILHTCFTAWPHGQIILYANAKLDFLATAFPDILMPVALPIVPKVEFNFEVILYIAIFVS